MKSHGVIVEREPVQWTGRYNRVFGNKSATLSIKFINGEWWSVATLTDDDSTILCLAEACQLAEDLVEVVNGAKEIMSGTNGGAFLINEFGQIIVPSSYGDGERLYVGDLDGNLCFINSDTDDIVDFSNDMHLNLGDLWMHPYLGNECQLSKRGDIYSVKSDVDGTTVIKPPLQDRTLINNLREVRGRRGCRFIVNHHGIVLTKKEIDRGVWHPVYVGKINYNQWFAKEE